MLSGPGPLFERGAQKRGANDGAIGEARREPPASFHTLYAAGQPSPCYRRSGRCIAASAQIGLIASALGDRTY